MFKVQSSLLISALGLVFAAPLAAHADTTYDLTITGGTTNQNCVKSGTCAFSLSVVLTGSFDPSHPGEFDVTGATGTMTYDGVSTAVVLDPAVDSPDPNDIFYDDILYPNASQIFDYDGIEVMNADPSNPGYDNFFSHSISGPYSDNLANNSYDPVSSLTLSVAPTPEPSSLALLGTGVLGVAGAVRRRSQKK